MSEPGHRLWGEDLAPVWHIRVNGIDICADISKFVQSVSFENSIEMADKLELKISNPYFALTDDRNWINYKPFQPGNEAELWVGYGQADHFLGRAIIQKHKPSFPQDEYPTLTIIGYDKSFLMMKTSGDLQGAQGNKIKLKEPRPQDKKDNQGRSWKDVRHSDIISSVANKYGLLTDIDVTTKIDSIVQKKGMTDWALIKGLANLNGKELWVDYDLERHSWLLHWKSTEDGAKPIYDFIYQLGDKTTLLNCEIEYGIMQPLTNLQVLAWDQQNEKWISIIEVEDVESDDPKFKAGPSPRKGKPSSNTIIEEVIASSTEFRLAAAGTSIDVLSDHTFKDAESLARFASRWYLENKWNFMIAEGTTVGVETLKARQVHNLSNLSKRIDGSFYFITVKHSLDVDGGYFNEFVSRKVIS